MSHIDPESNVLNLPFASLHGHAAYNCLRTPPTILPNTPRANKKYNFPDRLAENPQGANMCVRWAIQADFAVPIRRTLLR